MSERPPLLDAEARARIAGDLDATLFVEAAAGTGKTTQLVARIVALLTAGRATLDQIVAVTFTEKAAGEMKLRLRAEIERARTDPASSDEARERLVAAIEKLEVARIGTIHAFCQDILRERPVEAKVDPLFEVAPQDESDRLLDRAFESWFQDTLDDPPEGVRRVLRRRPSRYGDPGPRGDLRWAANVLIDHRDFDAPWTREPFAREPEIDRLMERLGELAEIAKKCRGNAYIVKSLKEIGRYVEENRLRELVRDRDHDALEAELRTVARWKSWRWKGRPGSTLGPGILRDEVVVDRDAAKEELDGLLEKCDADLAALLRLELRPVVDRYRELKERSGKLDFLDLLLRARNLVRDDAAVREELQARFTHFFIDEFQDTDPLQAELVLLLAADDPAVADWKAVRPVPGKLFLVGDPKQSIYRFRRADVAIYEEIKRRLAGQGADVLRLTTSFRAGPEIQSVVNAAFERAMAPDPEEPRGAQADYVPLHAFREPADDQPAVIALPVPRPYSDWGKVTKWSIEDSIPDAVGAFVHWLIEESGWKVHDRDTGERVPVQARHVCLLFRRFKKFRDDVTRGYVRALEGRRVPHVLVGGRSFHDREEVIALRNALHAIEWPDDELRVFATLRGPFFALGDDVLLAYRTRWKRLHPLRPIDADALKNADHEVAGALTILAGLHRGRNRRPIADTIARLLDSVRAHAGIAIWPTGEQALANCFRVMDMGRRFERHGAPSFRAFVERLEQDAERGDAEDAPVVEEGTEGVRMMTVHRAKGLEFPVVILADPTCQASRDMPSRHVDPDRNLWAEPLCGCAPRELLDNREIEALRDREESVRLAYVAATRARDLLVVPTVGDEEVDGWIDMLNPAVYPDTARKREPETAPVCPGFGEDSVFERPESAERGSRASVKPGLHRPRIGDHRVVWWDPHALDLDREPTVGIRQEEILKADEAGVAATEGIKAHDAWSKGRTAALFAGTKPSIDVVTATELAAGGQVAAHRHPVPTQEVPLDRTGRPGGRRFGTLVHATLATVPFDADEARVANVTAAAARLIGAPPDEAAAATKAVVAALAHDVLQRAAKSETEGGLRRETPILHRRPDGLLVEGVVDLAFRESPAGKPLWTVVDFKTDRELTDRREIYEEQVRIYVDAIAAATGEPARGMLLVV